MEPSEVRRHILADHQRLRRDLEALEELAERVQHGEPKLAASLRKTAQRFLAALGEHMRWEDRFLLPALREADAWGRERALALVKDHREQREMLAFIIDRLHDEARPAKLVGRDVGALVEHLRLDMEEEERDLLDPRVLRDDVVAIDVNTG